MHNDIANKSDKICPKKVNKNVRDISAASCFKYNMFSRDSSKPVLIYEVVDVLTTAVI